MDIFISRVEILIRKGATLLFGGKIKKLYAVDTPFAAKIADAISAALHNQITRDEKKLIDSIEQLRKELRADKTELTITDYGAGKHDQLFTEKEMKTGVVKTRTLSKITKSSQPRFWALLLFKLVKEFKPGTLLELGTSLGISTAYQAAAQKLNDKGSITTIEGADSLTTLAKNNLQKLGFENVNVVTGRFMDKLDKVLNEIKPVDYIFVDGHHDGQATISYYKKILPFLADKAVIIFDDISWSKSMRSAWEEITEDKTVKFYVNLRNIGICIIDNSMNKMPGFKILR